MPQDYAITESRQTKSWESKYGTMLDYALKLEGVDGWVQLSQKQDTKPPQTGDTLYGRLEDKEYNGKTYKKFRKERKDGGSFQKKSSGKSPEERHQIDRLNARTAAVDFFGHYVSSGKFNDPLTDVELVLEIQKKLLESAGGRMTDDGLMDVSTNQPDETLSEEEENSIQATDLSQIPF